MELISYPVLRLKNILLIFQISIIVSARLGVEIDHQSIANYTEDVTLLQG